MQAMFAHAKAVLFDLDGTLVDSAPDLGAAVDKMRVARGLPSLPLARYRPMAGAGARGMLGEAFGIGPDYPDFSAMREEFFDNLPVVLGLAIGKPDQAPALKPRMPRELQFFDDVYPSDDDATESIKERIGAFDVSVHEYYDLRNTDRPVDAFSDQIASIAAQRMDAAHQVIPNATSQGFRLDR